MQDDVITSILASLAEVSPLIQVILGPRQVGKTTAAREIQKKLKSASHYVSADDVAAPGRDWILENWLEAKSQGQHAVLIIDEIQKIHRWSETIKKLWDEQATAVSQLKVILLGSSSLQLHDGLSESLAGRFELHHLFQWGWAESNRIHKMSLDEYLKYGGYPGSYRFINQPERWRKYLKDSVVDTVIERDILANIKVKSPALFRQSFELFMSYPAQEISYNKLLGQLQDRGNIDLVKHYMTVFEQAFLLKSIRKYSGRKILAKTSSPKIIPMCPALVQYDQEYEETGRVFEAIVGTDLLKAFEHVFYWRDGKYEVDYVVEYGKSLYAIEVKSGRKKIAPGLSVFQDNFPKAQLKIVHRENYSDFVRDPRAWLAQ
jgi:predicted AAA+ superfamily ATPase